MRATPSVFICYRRDAGGGYAGRLAESLSRSIGPDAVFIDEKQITPGEGFPAVLHNAVEQCRVMVVVIGPGWSRVADGSGIRLHQQEDWVRTEIETALAQLKKVIPILVGRAAMPSPGELPESIARLAELQAVDVRDASWDDDVRRLVQAAGLAPRRRFLSVVSLSIAAMLLVAIGLVFSGLTPISPSSPNLDRLTTLSPTQGQQEALASLYSGSGMNVPVLRYFLAQASKSGVRTDQLDDALRGFAWRLKQFQLDTDTMTLGGHGNGGLSSEEDAAMRQSIRTALSGDFDGALLQLPEIAAPDTSSKGTERQGGWLRPAFILYKRGQLQALRRDWPQALGLLDEAVAHAPPSNLRWSGLQQAARLSEDLGDFDGAARRLEAAETSQLRSGTIPGAARLALERADLLRRAGRKDDALSAHLKAQEYFDREINPGNSEARDSATRLADELQRRNRTAEAAALRTSYGLPSKP